MLPSHQARALMVRALATYDEASGSDNPILTLTILVADTPLLEVGVEAFLTLSAAMSSSLSCVLLVS